MLKASAAAYYRTGPARISGVPELLDNVASVRAQLMRVRESDEGVVSVRYTEERVRASTLTCPLPNNDYVLTVGGATYEIDHRPASLSVTAPSGEGPPLQGTYLYALGQVVLRSRFSADDLPPGWVDSPESITCAEDVVCVIPDKSAASRARGATRAGARSGVFITAREIQAIAGGELATQGERRVVNVEHGEVQDVEDYSTVLIGEDKFVALGGRLIELDTSTPAHEINGSVTCDVSTTTLTFRGAVTLSDASFVTYITEGGDIAEGDEGDRADGTPATRVALNDALAALPRLDLLEINIVTSPAQASAVADYALLLDQLAEQATFAASRLTPTRQRALIDELLSRMERVGLDRAADILRGGGVNTFLALNGSNATYAAVLRDAGSQLKVQVQQ